MSYHLDHRLVWLALTTALVLGANLWMAAHRSEGYGHRIGSYPSAYLPAEEPVVAEFARGPDEAWAIELSPGTAPGWSVQSTPLAAASREGSVLLVQVPLGIFVHEVSLAGAPAGTRRFFTTSTGPAEWTYGSPDLLVGDFERHTLAGLTTNVGDYAPADVARARTLLAPLALEQAPDTEARLEKLWEFLHQQLKPHYGRPPADLIRAAPLFQYDEAMQGRVGLHCANLASILAFFSTVAGIPARLVDATGVEGGVELGAHTFVEVYLPERQRFAYTDLMLSILMVRAGAGGPPLNTVELVQLMQARASNVLVARVRRDGVLIDMPFDALSPSPSRLIHPSATFVFHRDYVGRQDPWRVMRRYLFAPEPAYALHRSNARYQLKLAGFASAVCVAIGWGIAAACHLSARRDGKRPG